MAKPDFEPVRVAEWVEYPEIEESEAGGFESSPHGFEPWLSQTSDFKIDTYHSPAWRSALLG